MTTEQSRIKPVLDAVATAAEAMAGEWPDALDPKVRERLKGHTRRCIERVEHLAAPFGGGEIFDAPTRDEMRWYRQEADDINEALATIDRLAERASSDQWLAFATRIRAIVNQELRIVDTKPALDFTLPGKPYPGEAGR